MVHELGGRVEQAPAGEFGRSQLTLRDGGGKLLDGLPAEQQCWMSHRDTVFEPPPGLQRTRLQHRVAGGGRRGHRARPLRDPVPPRGRPHPLRHRDPHPLPPRRRRLPREVVAGLGDRGAGGGDPRAGRRGARDLRPLRRRRLGDRRPARPPRDRRPPHLRLRRPRDDAQGRGRAGRHRLPRAARHPAGPRRCRRPLPRPPRRRRRPRDEAQDHRRGVHPRLRGGGRRRSRTPASWSRARSTRT